MAVLTINSCCSTRPWAETKACRLAATCACARVTSIGACCALFNFVLVVFIQPLGEPQCFALHLEVFVQTHQVRIEPGDAGHRVDYLLSKYQVGDLLVVLGDANVPAIQSDSETAQQGWVMVNPRLELRIGL